VTETHSGARSASASARGDVERARRNRPRVRGKVAPRGTWRGTPPDPLRNRDRLTREWPLGSTPLAYLLRPKNKTDTRSPRSSRLVRVHKHLEPTWTGSQDLTPHIRARRKLSLISCKSHLPHMHRLAHTSSSTTVISHMCHHLTSPTIPVIQDQTSRM
jgi:hypothetical protein